MFTNVFANNPDLAAAVLLCLFNIDQERAVRVADELTNRAPDISSELYLTACNILCGMQNIFPQCGVCGWAIVASLSHTDCAPCPNGCGEPIWDCDCDLGSYAHTVEDSDPIDNDEDAFDDDPDDPRFDDEDEYGNQYEDEDPLAGDVDPTGGYPESSYIAPGPNGPERVYYDPTNPRDPNRPLEYSDEDDEL